jgi:hypothetical protein
LDGDLLIYFAAGLIGAFLVLSWTLLSRYRHLAARVTESTDLDRELWNAMDSRFKKQDERILDVMMRLDVYETKLTGSPPPPASEIAGRRTFRTSELMGPQPKEEEPPPQPGKEETKRPTGPKAQEPIDRVVLRLLVERPRTSVEIKSLIRKSREHSARLMKDLFDRRLVSRNDTEKPFVYELTEEGRRYLSAS